MHIAIVRKHFTLHKAGAERYSVNLSRHLMRLGHQITVIGEWIDPELSDTVNFLPVKVSQWTSWTRNRSFANNAAAVIRAHQFDIVHGLSRTPEVDTFRVTDPLQAHWINVFYQNQLVRSLQNWNPRHRTILDIERSVFQSARTRRYITQSKLDSRLLVEYYQVPEDKIVRVYNGVDTEVFHPRMQAERATVRAELGIEKDQPLLVFASMDFRRKGLGPLLMALSLIRTRDVKLLILGAGDQRTYRRLARELGVERMVVFAGRQRSMARYYGAGDLFVLPTIYEPFPNVNLESMGCGMPVLTSATAGGADIIEEGKNGYLVQNPLIARDLADCIDRHFSLSSAEKLLLSEACVRTAQGMTMERNASQMVAVFEDVLREQTEFIGGHKLLRAA